MKGIFSHLKLTPFRVLTKGSIIAGYGDYALFASAALWIHVLHYFSKLDAYNPNSFATIAINGFTVSVLKSNLMSAAS